MRHENASILELDGKEVSEFTPSKPREKWLRKRTHVKIRVGSALLPWLRQEVRTRWFHFPFLSCASPERDGQPPRERRRLHGGRRPDGDGPIHVRAPGHGDPHRREGEAAVRHCRGRRSRKDPSSAAVPPPPQIDIHIMTQPPSGEWVHFHTELTNSSGRVSYVLPENKRLGIGVYPVKMVVR